MKPMPILRRLAACVFAALLLLQSVQASEVVCMGMADVAAAGAAPMSETTHMAAHGAPQDRHRDDCPDRDAARSCTSMLACAPLAALPSSGWVSLPDQGDPGIVAPHLVRPPTSIRAPELPPPRA